MAARTSGPPPLRAGHSDDADRYELRRTIAAGAEGILYDAARLDDQGDVRVAVKMLHPGHHADFDRWAARWVEQAELLQHLAAPGLVRVRDSFVGPLPHAAGDADPTSRSLYLVMDWVEGEPLWTWAEQHPGLSAEALLLPLLQVGTALDLLHSGVATGGRVLIHGDVKPSNILISPAGTVLVDLGAVRMFDAARQSGISGTQGYVAPEVLADGAWSAASDRYALGCVALALLCGKEPPPHADEGQLRSMLEAAPRCQRSPDVVAHVMAMLATDPAARPTNCANWLAQVRGSSIVTTAREAELPPLAPGRTSTGTRPATPGHPSRRGRGVVVVASVLLALVLAGGAAAVSLGAADGDDVDDPTAAPTTSTSITSTVPASSTPPQDLRAALCVRRTDGTLTIRDAPAGGDTGVAIPEGACDVRDLGLALERVFRRGDLWRHVEWQGHVGWVADDFVDPVGEPAGATTPSTSGTPLPTTTTTPPPITPDTTGATTTLHPDVLLPPEDPHPVVTGCTDICP